MHVFDIMTSPVITAGPNAGVLEVVQLMLDKRISAIPIVNREGGLIGLVSEGDLMRRSELGARDYKSWWLSAIGGSIALAEEFVKSHGVKASEIMTEDVITVPSTAPVWEVAALLEKKKIKRVPVVDDGKLVGIVSRANLLQALAAQREKIAETPSGNDRGIREALIKVLEKEPWSDASHVNVVVLDGVVHYWGLIPSKAQSKAIRVAAEDIPGVKGVVDHTHSGLTLISTV